MQDTEQTNTLLDLIQTGKVKNIEKSKMIQTNLTKADLERHCAPLVASKQTAVSAVKEQIFLFDKAEPKERTFT